ncbi:Uncharacterized protein FWK35_00029246 [Aphis craccivora]|uniref:Uncharacterized protein n=1 Tax=Aphis craccivora TaxID=307492 RepID=A0A6G0W385_APHCR|nr:Uncharacterized protein FWK35_00029246 [Aphis craccivora]
MDSLKLTLTTQTGVQFISIGDLTVDRAYPILKMVNKDTQYGRAIICTLEADEGTHLEAYLPKSVQLEDDEIFEFNARTNKNLKLIYKGQWRRAFNITFE